MSNCIQCEDYYEEVIEHIKGLHLLNYVVNVEEDLDKASDIINDLLLGYRVEKDWEKDFNKALDYAEKRYQEDEEMKRTLEEDLGYRNEQGHLTKKYFKYLSEKYR